MIQRLAILDDYQGVALAFADWDSLRAGGTDITVFRDHLAGLDALAQRLGGFDAVVAMRERTAFPRPLLEKLPDLRLLVTTGMANDSIDLAAARELGITVCGTGGSPAAAPELTWALLLAVVRGIPGEDRSLRAGRWQAGVGVELSGKTLGVLGLGRIGRRVSGYARAFGMDVVAWSPNLTEETAADAGVRRVGKDALFEQSDIVTIHVRLSERSRGIVGARELQLLGPDGYLINTARGPLVDEEALLAALETGAIAGAAIDVFDTEPLPAGSRLAQAPRTVLTPHVGYVTRESYQRYYSDALEDVRAWQDGQPVRVLNAPASP